MNHIHEVKEFEDCHECHSVGCVFCHKVGGWPIGWYFWDETGADRHGPYESEEEAEKQLDRYCKEVLG